MVKCILFGVWCGWWEAADVQEAYAEVIGRVMMGGMSPVSMVVCLGWCFLDGATFRSSGRGRSLVPLSSAVATHLSRWYPCFG